MKTTAHLSALTLSCLFAGCFPSAPPVWGEAPPEVPPEEEAPDPLEPFGPTVASALTAGVADDPVADCAPSAAGLAAELAGLTPGARLGVGAPEIDVAGRPDRPYLQDEFVLGTAAVARDRPFGAGCVEEGVAGRAVAAAARDGASVGALIRHAADVAGVPAWRGADGDRGDAQTALEAICAQSVVTFDPATGEQIPPDVADLACGPGEGELPADLAGALTPVLWAIHDGVAARKGMDALHEARTADFWRDHGGRSLLAGKTQDGFNAGFEEDRVYLDVDRGHLYGAAAAIADAVQSVDWSAFRGREGVRYDFPTPAGWVRVRGAEPDTYGADEPETLLLVDLGGADVHHDEVASNRSGMNAVSVVIDLDGADDYAYPEAAGANLDRPLLPRDVDGTVDVPDQIAGGSASLAARQGAARNGIAMLFDLGSDGDRYVALRASQGYAHQGVGVLFDEGGADTYAAEQASQGAGQFGLGLLVDLGREDDVRRATNTSQGYGYVGGVGLLFDQGGDDLYACSPDSGGNPTYISPPMPGEANASMCQGAGQGFRIKDETFSLAGGVGALVDAEGDDRYEAGVFAQGVGYWQGFGLLSDRSGSDVYDAYYYAQGAAAHFGTGYLADGGSGSDVFQSSLEARNFVLGAAQDFSVAVFVNESGDDTYQMPDRGAGVASCGSVALFVDNEGTDVYRAPVGEVAGYANGRGCGSNSNYTGTAVFLDVGGQDRYDVSAEEPANDARWQRADGPDGTVRAFARDTASGDSGVHVGR